MRLSTRLSDRAIMIGVALALVVAACDSTAPRQPVPSDSINGFWTAINPPGTPPGGFVTIRLALTGTSVTGDGKWAGEAGPFGSIIPTGTVVGDSVTLDLTFASASSADIPSRHYTFAGTLRTTTDLVGVMTADDGSQSSQGFKKIATDPVQ